MSHKNCKCVECGQTGKMQEMMNKGIIENGFIVIPIVDANPPFAYTVGLTESCGKPELIAICNMDPMIIAKILHELAYKVKENSISFDEDGTIENALTYYIEEKEIKGPVGCKTVKRKYKEKYMCKCCQKYGGQENFVAKQVIIGDLNAKLPWEEGSDKKWIREFKQKQLWS